MRALLEVNLLLSLFDAGHGHHLRAVEWWKTHQPYGWASCPLTENGFVRIISGAGYPEPIRVDEAVRILRNQIGLGGHDFWPDDLTIADQSTFAHPRILGPKQLTDIYLLALAVKHGGRLVTFDRTIPVAAVHGAKAENLVVL